METGRPGEIVEVVRVSGRGEWGPGYGDSRGYKRIWGDCSWRGLVCRGGGADPGVGISWSLLNSGVGIRRGVIRGAWNRGGCRLSTRRGAGVRGRGVEFVRRESAEAGVGRE